jgi:hypothetical protein
MVDAMIIGWLTIPIMGDGILAGTRIRRNRTRGEKIVALDGRSRLALAIKDARLSYLGMCPQPVSPVDAALCERLAILNGHLLTLDQKALSGGLTQVESRLYTTLSGQQARLLKQLNLHRSTRPVGPSLAEIFGGEGAAA